MASKQTAAPLDIADALLKAFATNDRINHYLLRAVPREAWNADPPAGKGRTIAAIAAHMHNVRLMWLKSAAAGAPAPAKLEGGAFSTEDAVAALDASRQALHRVIEASLRGDGRIKGFKPDVASFLGYLFAHDAHHRGQITMLARQLGHPVAKSVGFGLWEWGTR
jgi:uncharacterized damage-inducible protein DinB